MPPKRKSSDKAAEAKSKKLKEEGTSSGEEETSTSTNAEDSEKKWNLKIGSWNVNGIRAWLNKNGFDYMKKENLDIFCLQETKCSDGKIPDECKIDGYFDYWNSAETEGYSGCALYSKTKPLSVTNGIGIEKHDKEGRVITAEYDSFYLVTAYIPNAGKKLVRLDYRSKEWDVDFLEYLKKLDAKKPVILCGDLNVAHKEIDLKNPKTNKKNAGFTTEERDGFTKILDSGFVDSFRYLYPEKEGAYTFWTYMMNARAKDVGWRLDYFVIAEKLTSKLCDSLIHKTEMGSDHCPVVLLMNM